jgi:hypothetical protein
MYYRARFYHPALGRFVSADTIVPEPGQPQDFNRYAYVRNNPLIYIDPSGHVTCIDGECNWVVDPVSGDPEWRGESLETWRNEIVAALMDGGPECQRIAQYIISEDIEIGFANQRTKARWTLSGDIALSIDHYSLQTSPRDVQLLGSVAEETQHLMDGFFMALSIEGEIRGPRTRINVMKELGHRTYPVDHPIWQSIINTPENPTDRDLRHARGLILEVTDPLNYWVWALPLRPEYWREAPFVLTPFPMPLSVRMTGLIRAYYGIP